jgi:hypothetical protein
MNFTVQNIYTGWPTIKPDIIDTVHLNDHNGLKYFIKEPSLFHAFLIYKKHCGKKIVASYIDLELTEIQISVGAMNNLFFVQMAQQLEWRSICVSATVGANLFPTYVKIIL